MNFFNKMKYRYYNGKALSNIEELTLYVTELASKLGLTLQCSAEFNKSADNTFIISTLHMPSLYNGKTSTKDPAPTERYLSVTFKVTVTNDGEVKTIINKDISGYTDLDEIKRSICVHLESVSIEKETKRHFSVMMAYIEDQYPEVLADLVLNELLPDKETYEN